MTKALMLFMGFIFLTSCGLTRHRAGYYPMEERDPLDCEVRVATMATVDDLQKVEVGVLTLGEAPFLEYPWICNKEDALKVIREEACNVNANFANIIHENYPTFMQSCYHCTVVLYRVPDTERKKLKEAIAKSQETEPDPDPDWNLVVLGKFIKTAALVGAVIGIRQILRLAEI